MFGTAALIPILLLQQSITKPFEFRNFESRLGIASRHDSEATALAADLQKLFGKDLDSGANPRGKDGSFVWALRAESEPTLVRDDGTVISTLKPVGKSGIYASMTTQKDGDGFPWHYEVKGKRIGGGVLEYYIDDPDTKPQTGVAKGTLTQQPDWVSKVFPGAIRNWWVYVPAGLKPGEKAAVMVFQDGQWMKNYVPTSFDNLIAKKQMPPTVGIFLEPGRFADGRSERSFEYDTLSGQYAQFLLDEILPEVEKQVPLRQDAAGRATCGMSSGGICSFTVAWERPDAFGKVMSWIGSFTNIAHGPDNKQGGHNYSAMIRLMPKKPIRVYLQDGRNDLNNQFGSWPLANEQLAKSLEFAGYDYKFTYGNGAHNDRHGRAKLPEMLRWLWRD